jgi:hypothetical protein
MDKEYVMDKKDQIVDRMVNKIEVEGLFLDPIDNLGEILALSKSEIPKFIMMRKDIILSKFHETDYLVFNPKTRQLLGGSHKTHVERYLSKLKEQQENENEKEPKVSKAEDFESLGEFNLFIETYEKHMA